MFVDVTRQAVLIDMAYEIGGSGLAGFTNLLAAMRAGKWATAAVELKNSRLYGQVPRREQENMSILTLGEFPAGITCAEELIRHHEGCTFTAKPDDKGKWSIGWGHDIQPPPEALSCTQEEADAWFSTDFALATQRAQDDLGVDYWG